MKFEEVQKLIKESLPMLGLPPQGFKKLTEVLKSAREGKEEFLSCASRLGTKIQIGDNIKVEKGFRAIEVKREGNLLEVRYLQEEVRRDWTE